MLVFVWLVRRAENRFVFPVKLSFCRLKEMSLHSLTFITFLFGDGDTRMSRKITRKVRIEEGKMEKIYLCYRDHLRLWTLSDFRSPTHPTKGPSYAFTNTSAPFSTQFPPTLLLQTISTIEHTTSKPEGLRWIFPWYFLQEITLNIALRNFCLDLRFIEAIFNAMRSLHFSCTGRCHVKLLLQHC